jgi:hypothetical protein
MKTQEMTYLKLASQKDSTPRGAQRRITFHIQSLSIEHGNMLACLTIKEHIMVKEHNTHFEIK